ncbi:hypothetical protein FQR65_LT18684 [Abscondita terminalis]|nr:hypothetical protein FQR65_LT18684 [Abscondita terminalis]
MQEIISPPDPGSGYFWLWSLSGVLYISELPGKKKSLKKVFLNVQPRKKTNSCPKKVCFKQPSAKVADEDRQYKGNSIKQDSINKEAPHRSSKDKKWIKRKKALESLTVMTNMYTEFETNSLRNLFGGSCCENATDCFYYRHPDIRTKSGLISEPAGCFVSINKFTLVMPAPLILLLDKNHPLIVEQLSAKGFQFEEDYTSSYDEVLFKIHLYDGIIIRSRIPVDIRFLEAAKKLKFIARVGAANAENIDTPKSQQELLGICTHQFTGRKSGLRSRTCYRNLLVLMNRLFMPQEKLKMYYASEEESH